MKASPLRFTKGKTCPVCGGSDDDPRGEGKRCHGFISGDRKTIFCARQEHAGQARHDTGSRCYVHEARGPCPCGKKHAPANPAPARGGKRRGTVDSVYRYRDANRKVIFEVVRFKNPKGFAQRRPGKDAKGKPRWGLGKVDPVLYRLPELNAADLAAAVWVVEGEKDVDNLVAKGLIATCNPMGAGKWRERYAEPLRGRTCCIIPDNDQPGREHAQQVAQSLAGKARSVRVVELPGVPEKGDTSDFLASGGTKEQLIELALAAPEWTPPGPAPPGPAPAPASSSKPPPETHSQVLLRLAGAATLFHDPTGRAYAAVPVGRHVEVHAIRSTGFAQWLKRQFYIEEHRSPSAQSFQDALGVIEAKANFDGPEEPVFIRVAGDADRIIIDLGDPDWRVVIVTAAGWSITSQSPVWFRRPPGLRPLPIPEPGGSIEGLKQIINCDPGEFILIVAWLAAALRPAGPYPILILTGEQGSAKSPLARLLRSLSDPHVAPLRCEPKEARDLMIAASNSWFVVLDNLSTLAPWLSDALCRLSTGGAFATRTLYSNDEETFLDAMRPVILTGISDFVNRGDLIDRCLFLHLPTIPEVNRRFEKTIWTEFEAQAPRLLGALLDAISGGLRILPHVSLSSPPRMADFAEFGEAVSRALGNPPDHFLTAYRDNRQAANESAIEDSPVAGAVRELAARGPRTGTAAELRDTLGEIVGEKVAASERWPKSPRGLSGMLRRLAPSLRAVGVEVHFGRGHDRYISIEAAPRKDGIEPTQQAQPTPPLVLQSETCVGPASVEQQAQRPTQTGAATDATQPFGIQDVTQNGDGCVGCDGQIPPLSTATQEKPGVIDWRSSDPRPF